MISSSPEANDVQLRCKPSLTLLLTIVTTIITLLFASCAEPTAPTLDMTPESQTLVTGQKISLTVTRRFPSGPSDDVTTHVTYKSANTSVASVDDKGQVTAGSETGVVIVKAFDTISDATALATFTIVASQVASIDLTPSPAIVMPRGTSRPFTATAHFTDGTTRDVTAQVLWSSTNEAAAVVGNTSIDKGVVSAVASGDTTILATDATTLVQGRSIVFVAPESPHLVAVTVNPNPGVIGVGKTFQFGAVGVLSDGTPVDLTRTATWTSTNPAVATVDNVGVVTAVAVGDTTITAVAPAPDDSIRGSTPTKVAP